MTHELDEQAEQAAPEAPAVQIAPTDDQLRTMAAKRCCGCCKGTNIVAAELLLRRQQARTAIEAIEGIYLQP